MPAPIVLFVYNRPDHTRRAIEALAKNSLASDSDLWIFSDGPKSRGAISSVLKVREYLAGLDAAAIFNSVSIAQSHKNKGLAKSIISGVSKVMESRDNVIVLEDDLIAAPDFLSFMNDSLAFYCSMPVGAISGYSPIKRLPDDYIESVYVSSRSCSWGWATWKDRWQNVDWDASDFEQFRRNGKLKRAFDSTGADRFNRLRRRVQYNIDSWSIIFGFNLFMKNLLVIYPTVNRISNIGCDGSGVHSESGDFERFHYAINPHAVPYKLTFPPVDIE